jgi:hypothetical protein
MTDLSSSSEDVQADDASPPQSPDAEELGEEPRNLIMALVSEIRIGMDLSRITLPTFILEPRSLLDKLTDFMTHGELLALYDDFSSTTYHIAQCHRFGLTSLNC